MSIPITLQDILEAKKQISPYIVRTPLHRYRSLENLIGTEVYGKHEDHQPVGSFKIRGAVNIISRLTEEEKHMGVIVASTGNFGQSIAYACTIFGIAANVVVPINSNPGKINAISLLGANLIIHGRNFDESSEHAEHLSKHKGYRYIHSANEPLLISGVGTYSLEIVEDLTDVDTLIVPIGGGSGAAGACVAIKSLDQNKQVIGVQAEKAPAAYLSWGKRHVVESKMETSAEGLATRIGFDLTQSILCDMLDDFILVSEDELNRAIVFHLEHTHTLTEHAGAASLAAAIKIKNQLEGKKVAIVISGGNITVEQIKTALSTR